MMPLVKGIPAALAAITVANGLMVEPSADPRPEQHGGGCHNRVEPGGQHHRYQQGVKRQRLFGHAVNGAASGKQRHQDRDHPLFTSAKAGGDALDPGVNRAGFGDDPEEAPMIRINSATSIAPAWPETGSYSPAIGAISTEITPADVPQRVRRFRQSALLCRGFHSGPSGTDRPAQPSSAPQRRQSEKENGVSGRKLELAHDVLLKPGTPWRAGGD
jgi:hypothetical protein